MKLEKFMSLEVVKTRAIRCDAIVPGSKQGHLSCISLDLESHLAWSLGEVVFCTFFSDHYLWYVRIILPFRRVSSRENDNFSTVIAHSLFVRE